MALLDETCSWRVNAMPDAESMTNDLAARSQRSLSETSGLAHAK
jgi:hypothetical protein